MKKKEDASTDPSPDSKTKATRSRKAVAPKDIPAKAAAAEEKVEAAARKARKTASKVAAAVTETVKEIAGKVGRKASSNAAKKPSTAKAATQTRRAAETARAAKTPASRTTKTLAMAPGTTSDDVLETVSQLQSSPGIDESSIADESATDVKQHFFHDQHVHQGPPPPQAPRDLPDEYGDTKLVLLVRDPEWVYAYWEFNEDIRRHYGLTGDNGSAKPMIIRLFKITGRNWPDEGAHYFFDVEVGSGSRSWYIHLPEANEIWCAEIGIFDEQSNFVPVCRSNVFFTPRNSISDHVDSEWMTVQESFEKITRLSSASIDARLRGETSTGSSESILRTIQRQLTGVLHGERTAMSSGLFSSEAAIPPAGKDFWLNVNTEVILYGATEPDAHVTVQGRPVVLNADGTFSMRFAFPDGEQVLEVRAVKSSGDMEETITPVVSRITR